MKTENKNTIKKAFSLISNALLIVVLVCCVGLLFFAISMKQSNQGVTLFGYEIRQVVSGSMEPNIKTGSLVFINTTKEKSQIKEGDILTFKYSAVSGSPEEVITHRVIDIESVDGEIYYTLKGDAVENENSVQIIDSTKIIGIVTNHSYFLGLVNTVFQSKIGIVCCLIIPSSLIIIYEIYRIISVIIKDRNEKKPQLSDNINEGTK